MPLKVRIRSRTSATGLPLTAADISEADDWLIEQPGPGDLDVGHHAVVDVEGDHDLVPAQRVEPLDPAGRRRLAARPGSGASGSGRG